MGTVYSARQISMRRTVALKVLDAGVAPSESSISRFEREAWIGGRFNHPNIVRVIGQGLEGRTHWIAMELVEGHSLHDEIRRLKESWSEVKEAHSAARAEHVQTMVAHFAAVAEALQQVHEQGIVHRDLETIQRTLQQSIEANKSLCEIEPEWEHLEAMLWFEVEKRPDGPLSLLEFRPFCWPALTCSGTGVRGIRASRSGEAAPLWTTGRPRGVRENAFRIYPLPPYPGPGLNFQPVEPIFWWTVRAASGQAGATLCPGFACL